MTTSSIPFDGLIYDSFCTLRDSIDAISCAADLIPRGGDDESLGFLFRRLTERLNGDLTAHYQTLLPR